MAFWKVAIFVYALCILVPVSSPCDSSMTSQKKGISLWWENLECEDFQFMADIPWWYDWRNDIDTYKTRFTACDGVDHVLNRYIPMTWGRKSVQDLQLIVSADALLGFNEPNHMKQSNISAEEAATLWRDIESQSGNKPLVSPCAAKCGGDSCLGNDLEWFDEFFQHCNDCRVDFLATHYYNCNADNAMAYLEGLYQRYGKRLWLTEFACAYTMDPTQQLNYMKDVLPRLEAADFIYR